MMTKPQTLKGLSRSCHVLIFSASLFWPHLLRHHPHQCGVELSDAYFAGIMCQNGSCSEAEAHNPLFANMACMQWLTAAPGSVCV